jgi:GntR family histidine utilization transcriptional repressor
MNGNEMDTSTPAMESDSLALYERVKTFIRKKSAAGEWKPGDRIPSENELVKVLGVSRMTINRALRELTGQGELTRRGGVGTFVAAPKPSSTLLMIAKIGDEVRARGHSYRWVVILRESEKADDEVGQELEMMPGRTVYHVSCVHYENNTPIQFEDRYVNPVMAPHFLDQSFLSQPPSEYLLSVMPADEIEHTVDAVFPGRRARVLKIRANEPCLLLTRRTWAANTPVTFARLLYPAARYRLSCRFKPSASGDRG